MNNEEAPIQGWLSACFFIAWVENTEPDWHIDLLLAHQVISPILNHYREELALWRFHRRAAPDHIGHRFSFLFYTTRGAAEEVYSSLKSNVLLGTMSEAGIVLRVVYDRLDQITKPNIEDTSDPTWPATIRKSWPYFIMGVSEMWLGAIAGIAQPHIEEEPISLPKLLERYKEVNEGVTSLWQNHGRHAFLHHLNALFGYVPVVVPVDAAQALLMRF
jgi:hypothetical protein